MKRLTLKRKLHIGIIYGFASFWMTIFFTSGMWHKPLITPASAVSFGITTSKPSGQETAGAKPTVDQVKAYIKSIFGGKWKVAWSVAENECGHTRKEWPVCVNSWGNTPNKGEYSVGLFQINLARQEGRGARVHWDKVPGKDLNEKQLWLADYRNSVLTAFVISQGGENWNAWSAYSNGNYLRTLKSL